MCNFSTCRFAHLLMPDHEDKLAYQRLLHENQERNHDILIREIKSNDSSTSSNKFEKIIGCICALICILLWFGMSEFIPLLQTNYEKPYLLRYCVGSMYSTMIIVWYLINKFCEGSTYNLIKERGLTSNMIWSAFVLSVLYNLEGYCWYLSLSRTISSINNTIYQTSICVTYVFSVLLLPNYSMTWSKNVSVVLCVIGVAFISFGTVNQSDKHQTNTVSGIIECLLSMFGFGLFAVAIKIFGNKYYSHNVNNKIITTINSKLLMEGMMGLSCLLTLWPGIIIVHYLQIETFELPKNKMDILSIIAPSFMDTIYIGSLVIGISFTNPVFMSISQLLVIPITFLYDVVFNKLTVTSMAVAGTIFVFIGFLLMQIPIAKIIKYNKSKPQYIQNMK